MKTICCAAGYGGGGLGRILAELVESARANGELDRYFAFAARPDDPHESPVGRGLQNYLFQYTPLRFSPAWKTHLTGDRFDRQVARQLQSPPHTLVGLAGQSLHTFRQARKLGCRRLELVAANSHANNITRQHAVAAAQWKIEPSWMNEAQRRKMLAEYEAADAIHVISAYCRDSFIREGVPEAKLIDLRLTADPRFVPPEHPVDDGIFRLVYVGSLTVAKGLPVLLQAFSRLGEANSELVLVGGTATHPMRKYLERYMAGDPRIQLQCGDPLPHLHRASLYVHPSYEDGFAYAPMEALACGVPAVVTDQTGMKEHIREGVNGHVIAAGDVDALIDRLQYWKRRGRAGIASHNPG
jgi:glycosyltransferase involved in cell wall biosynthesis